MAAAPDEVLRSCERSDRLLRSVLGSTPEQTVRCWVPILALIFAAAVIATVAGWRVH